MYDVVRVSVLQWNPSKADTIGTWFFVRHSEVSIAQGFRCSCAWMCAHVRLASYTHSLAGVKMANQPLASENDFAGNPIIRERPHTSQLCSWLLTYVKIKSLYAILAKLSDFETVPTVYLWFLLHPQYDGYCTVRCK